MWRADSRICRRKNPPFHLTGWFTALPIPACPLPLPNPLPQQLRVCPIRKGELHYPTGLAFGAQRGLPPSSHYVRQSQRTLNARTLNPRIRSTPHHTVTTVISPD